MATVAYSNSAWCEYKKRQNTHIRQSTYLTMYLTMYTHTHTHTHTHTQKESSNSRMSRLVSLQVMPQFSSSPCLAVLFSVSLWRLILLSLQIPSFPCVLSRCCDFLPLPDALHLRLIIPPHPLCIKSACSPSSVPVHLCILSNHSSYSPSDSLFF